MDDGYHLSLSLSRELWEDLLRTALPVTLSKGEVDLAGVARGAVGRLGVRDRIAGLLEDRQQFQSPLRIRKRARALWRRRDSMVRRARAVVHVEASWRVELDDMGTHLRYGPQRVMADASLKGTAEGTVFLLSENIELPFHLERQVGASVAIGDIHYDQARRTVTGALQDLAVHFGDRPVMQLLSRLAEYALERRMAEVNPVPILRRAQVEEMVGPMGGAFRVKMGVEDLDLRVTDKEMTLRVRFGFTQAQIEDHGGEAGAES